MRQDTSYVKAYGYKWSIEWKIKIISIVCHVSSTVEKGYGKS
jgi:hypothetical protein